MNTLKSIALLLIFSLTFASCSDDDNPIAINEEEVITTMNVTLTPTDGGNSITLTSVDLDGDSGPTAPVITGGTLAANTTYTASVELLNETEDPAEDITEEVAEEDEDHQFFYASTIGATFSYSDEDADGNPVGINFSLVTGDSATGTITVILVHEPNKSADGVSDGTITNAGGETDIEVSFPVIIE